MDISYLGKTSFRLKGKQGTVLVFPDQKNEIEIMRLAGADKQSFLVRSAGEYEVGGISVFGYQEQGKLVFVIVLDGCSLVVLPALEKLPDESFFEKLGTVQVLMVSVQYPAIATQLISSIEPYYILPMDYESLGEFEKQYGVSSEAAKSLTLTSSSLPEQTVLMPLQVSK